MLRPEARAFRGPLGSRADSPVSLSTGTSLNPAARPFSSSPLAFSCPYGRLRANTASPLPDAVHSQNRPPHRSPSPTLTRKALSSWPTAPEALHPAGEAGERSWGRPAAPTPTPAPYHPPGVVADRLSRLAGGTLFGVKFPFWGLLGPAGHFPEDHQALLHQVGHQTFLLGRRAGPDGYHGESGAKGGDWLPKE